MTTTPQHEIDADWLGELRPATSVEPTFGPIDVVIALDVEGANLTDIEEEAWRCVSHFDGRAADEESLQKDWTITLRVHPLTQDHRLYRGVGTATLRLPS